MAMMTNIGITGSEKCEKRSQVDVGVVTLKDEIDRLSKALKVLESRLSLVLSPVQTPTNSMDKDKDSPQQSGSPLAIALRSLSLDVITARCLVENLTGALEV